MGRSKQQIRRVILLTVAVLGIGSFLLLKQINYASAASCSGRSFYIDYTGGSDSNNGTSTSTPWKRAPGMNGFAGTYAHQAHDCFYLKGGVTWPRAVLPWVLPGSGNVSGNDYIGVDQTYYTGASWSQPIIDAGGVNVSSSNNVMLDTSGVDYVTVDNIKFDRFTASNYTGGYGTCEIINALGAQHETFDHITGSNENVDFASDNNNPCSSVLGATYGTFQGSSVVQNSTFYGVSSTTSSAGGGILCFGNVKNVIMHDLTGMVFPCGHGEISGNLLYNCGYPNFPAGASSMHADAIQVDLADGTFYMHDNVIHDTGSDGSGNECESMLVGNSGETDYIWNNVLYNIHGNAMALTQNATPGDAAYIWNNTVVGGQDAAGYCVRSGHAGNWPVVKVQNNHCITGAGATVDPAVTATSLTVDHNLLQTSAQATTAGYTSSQTYAYSPTSGSSPTVGAGTNLTTSCSGTVASLCSDTTYAGAHTTVARPGGSTAWDIGAYMYSAGGGGGGGSAPSNTALPTISGTTVQGNVLTTTNGSWNNSPTSYTYQWQRCNSGGASCVDISGATSSTYTLISADVGSTVRSTVTATNASGSASANSAVTAVITSSPVPGDINSDGYVNASDLGMLLYNWDNTGSTPADINNDGYVNASDLGILLYNWSYS